MKNVKFLMVALMLAVSSMANAQSARSIFRSFERMLDKYCIEYYSDDFSGRVYTEGSIKITCDPEEAVDVLTGEYSLSGTHSYRGQRISPHTGVKWEAFIKELGDNKYRITFNKWYEPDKVGPFTIREGHWEKGRQRIYKYGSSSSR